MGSTCLGMGSKSAQRASNVLNIGSTCLNMRSTWAEHQLDWQFAYHASTWGQHALNMYNGFACIMCLQCVLSVTHHHFRESFAV